MERCSGREQDKPLFVVPLIIIKAFLAARQHPPPTPAEVCDAEERTTLLGTAQALALSNLSRKPA